MIALKQEELYKSRGYRATIRAGMKLLADNFKAIFKHVWPFSLALAVVQGLLVFIQNSEGNQLSFIGLASLLAVSLISLVVILLYNGRVLSMLNGKSLLWNAGRYFAIMLYTFALGLIIGFAIGFTAFTTQQIWLLVVGLLVFILLLLPYVYGSMKYYMEPACSFGQAIGKCYLTGLRHWGYIFVLLLLSFIAIGVVSCAISLPLIICMTARQLSLNGMVSGDAAGTPAYFDALVYVISVATYFVYNILSLAPLFVFYYMYGNIEAQKKERQQLKLRTTDEPAEDIIH